MTPVQVIKSPQRETTRMTLDQVRLKLVQCMIFLYWCSDQLNRYRVQNGHWIKLLPLWIIIKVILKQREQVQALCWNETVWDAGKLPTHPSPNPTLTPISHLGQNVGLGGGGWLGCFFFFRILYCILKQFVSNILLTPFKLVENESCVHLKSKLNLVDHKRSHFLKILFAARRSCSCGIKHWRNKVW